MIYVELDEEMEMPCMCDCGQWFDLNDGYESKKRPGILICKKCHEKEMKEEETK